jgi:glycosyltransferase involved in cell wall biosynthesis
MIARPTVSVIISFFNERRFIEEAITSVLAQTCEDWELLLVDDGSTDASSQIAKCWAQQYAHKITYLEHAGHRNRRLAASRNLGIKHARGKYIALLDADDVWFPHKLKQQLAILDSYPEAAMVYGCTQYWHSWTKSAQDVYRDFVLEPGLALDRLYKPPSLLKLCDLLGGAPIPSPSDILFRHEMVQRVGGFEEPFGNLYEDYAFLAKVFLTETIFVASNYWYRYRQHPNSISAVANRTGDERVGRRFLFEWLAGYLSTHGMRGTEVWKILRRKLWADRHPVMYRYFRRLAKFPAATSVWPQRSLDAGGAVASEQYRTHRGRE